MAGIRIILAYLTLLILSQESLGQYNIVGPDEVEKYKLVRLNAGQSEEGVGFIWDISPYENVDIDEDPDGEFIFTGPPGTYQVSLRVINFDTREIGTFRKTVKILGTPEPDPDDDDPPEPPKPPDPPNPNDPLRVLLIYESTEGMSTAKRNVFYSTEVASYLNQKTASGSDGIRSWRRWDKDIVNQEAPKELQDLWSAVSSQIANNQLPVIVIAKGTNVNIHDLPTTEEEALALLRKYGG